ncbi:MAG TPA: flagellar motor switch protein FliM [Soehngenia sp.]|nr:flagellar motor switch protein FliM [Soehngenia sp.]HPP31402.1 flagellar motor switch protein FliM [Soehngenia sp.]
MKQVLSQEEIDSLLKALNSGEITPDNVTVEEEKNKIKLYDFRRPFKLSKDHINSLYMIFENFSKIAGNTISSLVRNNVEIKIVAVEQISFDEFTRSVPNPTLLSIFKSKPLNGNLLVEISPQACYQVIELMCGSAEIKEAPIMKKKENFTEIELSILEELAEVILNAFDLAWNDIIELESELESLETNPQIIQIASPNEPVILISFTFELMENKNFMNICIPYISLDSVIDKLSFKNWFESGGETIEDNREIVEKKIMSVPVYLEVELGKTYITIRDFLNLEEGDCVRLDNRIDEPLKMLVEGKPHFLVRPGKVNNSLAVEVLQYIEEDVL